MRKYTKFLCLAAFSLLATACDSGGHRKNTEAPETQYGATIVAIDAVNKDTGEALTVEGLPVTGGTLTIDPNSPN